VILGPSDVTIAPPPESLWFGDEAEGSGPDPDEDIESWLGPESWLDVESIFDEAIFDEAIWHGGPGDLEDEGVWDWVQSIGTGAATGAATGAVAGPWGALIGAIGGAALGAAQQAAKPQAPASPKSPPAARASAAPPPARRPVTPARRPTGGAATAGTSRTPAASRAPAATAASPAAGQAPAATDAGEVVRQLAVLIPIVAQLATTFQGTRPSAESDDEGALALEEWEHQEELPLLENESEGDEYEGEWSEGDDESAVAEDGNTQPGDAGDDDTTGQAIAAEWQGAESDAAPDGDLPDNDLPDGDWALSEETETAAEPDGEPRDPIDRRGPQPTGWPEAESTDVEWDSPIAVEMG